MCGLHSWSTPVPSSALLISALHSTPVYTGRSVQRDAMTTQTVGLLPTTKYRSCVSCANLELARFYQTFDGRRSGQASQPEPVRPPLHQYNCVEHRFGYSHTSASLSAASCTTCYMIILPSATESFRSFQLQPYACMGLLAHMCVHMHTESGLGVRPISHSFQQRTRHTG